MISLAGVNLQLHGFALQDINLKIDNGDYFILVGPSASGKTLLLETIAGLHNVTSGKIWIDGRDITSLESEKRNIGMVYQDCALFPHLTVRDNIVFGLVIRGKKPAVINRELKRIVQLLNIGYLLDRRPHNLSGGEKQKVALARALVTNPELLLLDEPLGALDPQTRETVRQEINKLHQELGITILHVTHDFEEAVTLGTRIAVIGEGSIKQAGLPDEIFHHPNSRFVAYFTMAVNVFPGAAERENDNKTFFIVENTRFETEESITGACYAAIRPENILLSNTFPVNNGQGFFTGVITGIINRGSIINIIVDLPPTLVCLLTRNALEQMNLTVGQQVYLTVPPSSVYLFTD